MSTASTAPVPVSRVHHWAAEADVLVAGNGCAGASASIEAVAAGAEVLVVDAAGGWGGATAMSGGEIYLGGGTSVQKACGFEDSVDAMYAFLKLATGPDPAEDKLAVYCEGSLEHFDWLVRCGVTFVPKLWTEPSWEAPTGYGLMYTGGENAYPFAGLVPPAPRGHIVHMEDKLPGERSAGWMLIKNLTATQERAGVEVRYNTRAERLVVDGERVVGAEVVTFGERYFVRARRGVVLAAGGFAANPAMLSQHAPRLATGTFLVGTDNDDGRGIRMGQAVGAAVRHMDAGLAAFPADPALLYRSLLLNGRGHRFINEDTYPGRVGQATVFQQDRKAFLLYDETTNEEAARLAEHVVQPTWVSDDLGELEKEMGIAPGVLAGTVAVYNAGAERGEDPEWHKAAQWLRPLEPPYGVLDLREAPYGVFTIGGLHTSTRGEVLNAEGDPIPGLFAAGRTTSGIPSWGYCSGTSLGDSTFFGRRAGRAVATA
ncbi:putative fumarate reductase/succinate dehydrogenase [Sphaerisporangium krabiense]|uniref:3-oxo-5alpha-steroid 4-dehydrogenase n=1 Tax=Sphaerisporangium krabiense TaxID=763782 RepID=A0A7W8Z0F0_9ACTN|nr:FAD-dependent oxidoreductase [Sphaerisporangium krabiense]MBB5625174.1 3-oxo-5alpha-steroid 4-dehydrogenase [Sphaerisporangium krabiense]GII64318.1 putative fumarate reductase/succinate dehydrogenase [Sphaerisporangium krabiense]